MLRGKQVCLRARHEDDVPILDAELYNDVATRARADSRAWRPLSPGSSASRYAIRPPSEDAACFSVVELAGDELAGEAVLWAIDNYQRTAHIGMSLRPAFRGRGLAPDIVNVLCHYGFKILGLHRLQVDTLADNAAMIATARRVGFTLEGTLRQGAWVMGTFADEVVLGLLAEEWRPSG
ncbi:MAG TPA: GNAT family protein [Pseudonocardiaceae bacterium]